MKNENIMCIKYLILELKQNKSSAKPINDNKLQIKIIWDISLLPLKVTNIIFVIKTIKIKNIPPLFSFVFLWDDLSLGISLNIFPINGIEYLIKKFVKEKMKIK